MDIKIMRNAKRRLILKPTLILDKSWLVGASRRDVEIAIRRFHLLVPEILLYELLTSDDSQRLPNLRGLSLLNSHTFSGVGTVGSFLAYEMERGAPIGRLLNHRKDVQDVFLKLANPDYEPSAEESRALRSEQENREKATVSAFMVASRELCRLRPRLLALRSADDDVLLGEIRLLMKDEDLLEVLYTHLRSGFSCAAPERVDHRWACYRRTQAHLMMATVYLRSYGDTEVETASKALVNLYLDTEYLVLAALSGALATGDILLRELFLIMCPEAEVISLIPRSKEKRTHNTTPAPDC